ncbi:lactate dehydrogenase [Clostridiaceae bacterium]|nr:lactate dehydrogenase [Clostridiaceae bacterium]RKI17989.1 lactate dehydrogenase [bacterium 1XD21-70]
MKGNKRITDLQGAKNGLLANCHISWVQGGGRWMKRVVVAGLGDVGSTLLSGLVLLGREVIRNIGIYDVNVNLCQRLYLELNQIVRPFEDAPFPPVYIAEEKKLFDCDVFIFCVAKSVPAVGSGVRDVRMAQFEANESIISWYAKKAADEHFSGLFVVVSDPVERLCKAVLKSSGKGSHPLHPYQVTGCGLGVMNARAVFHARQSREFEDYLISGRVFGAHGQELVVANDITEIGYDDERSRKLTRLVLEANQEIRKAGFKPYIAPALSSGAMAVLQILKGRWSFCSNYLGGVYFGGRSRTTSMGIAWEDAPLPEALFARLEESYQKMEEWG